MFDGPRDGSGAQVCLHLLAIVGVVAMNDSSLRFSCICVLKTLQFTLIKRCDVGALKETGQCGLGDCVPKRSVSSCDLGFRVAI